VRTRSAGFLATITAGVVVLALLLGVGAHRHNQVSGDAGSCTACVIGQGAGEPPRSPAIATPPAIPHEPAPALGLQEPSSRPPLSFAPKTSPPPAAA
jgi:hypothetical protein